jgi:hypothetical protein
MQDDQRPEPFDRQQRARDPLLDMWIQQAERNGLEPTITLMVGGLLVSGTLVGIRKYLGGVGGEFRNATSETPGVGHVLADAFGAAIALADVDEPDEGDDGGPSDDDVSASSFIHLKDVRVSFGLADSIRGPWWRGRLEAVDGCMLGAP